MAIWNHFLPLGLPKMRLRWVWKSHISDCRLALRSHFQPLDQPKKPFGWDRENDVSRALNPFELIFGLLNITKCDVVEVEKAVFLVVARHTEFIFSHQTNKKCGLCEFRKANIQFVVRHCELTFCLLTRPKCDLGEVGKAMIRVVEFYIEAISTLRHFTSRKSDVSSGRMAVLPLDKPKYRLGWSRK